MIGQTITGLSQSFLYNGPAKLSANWFGINERIYSTNMGLIANILGNGFGYYVPTLFLNFDKN